MKRSGILHKSAVLLTVALGVATPLAIWMLSPWRPGNWLAARFYAEMEKGEEDEQLDLPARQLAVLGEPGWTKLVQGLHHNRPEVRLAAERAIQEMLNSWQKLPATTASQQVATLARLLARQISSAHGESFHTSANLAERLLGWPATGSGGTQMVYDCEQVLRAARKAGWPAKNSAEPAPEPPRLTLAPPPVDSAETGKNSSDPSDVLGSTTQRSEIVSQDTETSDYFPVFSYVPASQEPFTTARALPLIESSQAAEVIATEPASPPALEAPRDWSTLELQQVLRLWRDPRFAAAAEHELRWRRFEGVNLRIARVAADADPENRVKLAKLLPQLSGVNATSWLLVLAQDESPRVRSIAVQLLATATDPQILAHLQKLEETELDPDVRAVLRKSQTAAR